MWSLKSQCSETPTLIQRNLIHAALSWGMWIQCSLNILSISSLWEVCRDSCGSTTRSLKSQSNRAFPHFSWGLLQLPALASPYQWWNVGNFSRTTVIGEGPQTWPAWGDQAGDWQGCLWFAESFILIGPRKYKSPPSSLCYILLLVHTSLEIACLQAGHRKSVKTRATSATEINPQIRQANKYFREH